jgi:hypothetical protein
MCLMHGLPAVTQCCGVHACHAGLLLLSPEFVRKEYCMAELNILLRRRRAGSVLLLPVLYKGLEVGGLANMRPLYDTQTWCVKEEKPEGKTLDAWAADLKALTGICMIRCDQVAPCSVLCCMCVLAIVSQGLVRHCTCPRNVHAGCRWRSPFMCWLCAALLPDMLFNRVACCYWASP